MSGEDWLRRATRSLREEASEVTPDETERTRARVLASLAVVERRRNRAVLLFIPIAAVLAASAALAHEGVTMRRAWGWVAQHVSGSQEPVRIEAPPPDASAAKPAVPGPSEVAPENAPVPQTDAPAMPPEAPSPAAQEPALAANAPAPSKAIASPPTKAAPARMTADDGSTAVDESDATGLALYRSAHRLHFVDHDYAGAVAAWDEYLRAVPRGPLVVEARYNRAIALVRLGRDTEARDALEPFAHGRVEGGYRQAEANALLDALEARDR
jgi:TolA-binding protein